ncbi:MAG: aminotransferase class V-fold PLP-dependent enzyme [Alphaproteobacteria bacterium]|nr:aminotransferase class V-fold PLP-dependent enzyme [Alphaproteobacteria bacterium]
MKTNTAWMGDAASDPSETDTGAKAFGSETKPFGPDARADFMLERGLTYLNHGAFGACPRPVMGAAHALRERIEGQPSRFLTTELAPLLRQTADRLGHYLGARGEDIVFLDNATTAINAVLRSLVLFPGDDILTTSQTYGAVMRTLEFVCDRAEARLIPVHLDYPAIDADSVVQTILDAVTPRTRLLVIDHITSKTASILPVAEIAAECAERGILVLVDGAHGPGMVDTDIDAMGVTWYTGNCHKWIGAPRGAAFLWTTPDRQPFLRPTTISHHVSEGYTPAFDWPGTKDFTPYLTVPAALDYRAEYGEARLTAYCRDLAIQAGAHLASEIGTSVGVPPDMTGFMTTVKLPAAFGRARQDTANAIRLTLRTDHDVEVDIQAFEGSLWMRLSLYVYNDMEDVDRLARAINAIRPSS